LLTHQKALFDRKTASEGFTNPLASTHVERIIVKLHVVGQGIRLTIRAVASLGPRKQTAVTRVPKKCCGERRMCDAPRVALPCGLRLLRGRLNHLALQAAVQAIRLVAT
jgi:hypothetical protein